MTPPPPSSPIVRRTRWCVTIARNAAAAPNPLAICVLKPALTAGKRTQIAGGRSEFAEVIAQHRGGVLRAGEAATLQFGDQSVGDLGDVAAVEPHHRTGDQEPVAADLLPSRRPSPRPPRPGCRRTGMLLDMPLPVTNSRSVLSLPPCQEARQRAALAVRRHSSGNGSSRSNWAKSISVIDEISASMYSM